MDKEARQTAQGSTGKVKKSSEFHVPGMEQGAGDSPSAALSLAENEGLASLQSHLAKLQLPKSVHGNDDGSGDQDQEYDQDEEVSSEDDDDDTIEPLCSYPYGYIKRQTVYICVTCNDPSKKDWKPAGVCIGCRHACHQGHDVISMETRRHFKCDCGNKKFPEGTKCLLCPKEDVNDLNIYNGNYKGTFCSCNCMEADCVEEDPLYQCVVCEDWYHASHCNAKTEGIEKNYTDLVCWDCTSKLDFLRYYEPFDPTVAVSEAEIEEMMKYTDEDEDGEDTEHDNEHELQCKLDNLVKKEPFQKGSLWTLGWRGKLCRCTKCKEMYASLNVSFLLDKEDETRRYFDDEEDDTQLKICGAIQRFEEWLLQMDPKDRDEMFSAGPEVVKQKMKAHFSAIAENQEEEGEEEEIEGINEFLLDDQLLDQLLQAFTEFILDADGGTDYLLDVDALKSVFNSAGVIEEVSEEDEPAEQAPPSGQEGDEN